MGKSFAAIGVDATLLDHGMMPEQLARRALWQDGMLDDLIEKWQSLKKNLLALDEHWRVWTDWYDDILLGRNRAGLPDDLAEKLDLKIAFRDNEWWARGPAEVNGDIKRWTVELLEEANRRNGGDDIVQPAMGPGPQYDFVDGKLSIVAHLPTEEEILSQANLHRLLQNQILTLSGDVATLKNQYPALVNSIEEYKDLLSVNIDALDVTGVWSVGGALASFQTAYAQQNSSNTLEIPLEPSIIAQMQLIMRMHGAFIMGFEEGRDLVGRADAFALNAALLNEIEESGNEILNELSTNRNLVDDETMAQHRPVRDIMHELSWSSGRNGYAAYTIVRNSTLALTKLLVGKDPNVGSVLGLVAVLSLVAGDPSLEISRNAILYLQTYGSSLLSFFNHSPEMRAYIEHALKMIVDDAVSNNIDENE